jgi:NADH:ubiquinone oxidoreductase subunit 4 (subunit M)
MMLVSLLLTPILGIFAISATNLYKKSTNIIMPIKNIALITSFINLFISLIIFILFNFSNIQFQFVQEYHQISSFDFYLGLDGLSIYFVLLTTIITPIALLSN